MIKNISFSSAACTQRLSNPVIPVTNLAQPPNKLLSSNTASGDVYDSVMGEAVTNGATAVPPCQPLRFREYVVYDAGQAYPEYQITFERVD